MIACLQEGLRSSGRSLVRPNHIISMFNSNAGFEDVDVLLPPR